MEEDFFLEAEAVTFIRTHKQALIRHFVPLNSMPAHASVTVFMAGSPGAGKTEVSKVLISTLLNVPVRIDADEIRALCPGYTGSNSEMFQKAANKGVHILYNYALKHDLPCLLDGTFAYADAEQNVRRSLSRDRKVQVWFVYQDPLVAWDFTKERERKEGRSVPKDFFISSFLSSRKNVVRAKEVFGTQVELNILIKNQDTQYQAEWLDVEAAELDLLIPNIYTKDNLKRILI